jgi:hypothetical protein
MSWRALAVASVAIPVLLACATSRHSNPFGESGDNGAGTSGSGGGIGTFEDASIYTGGTLGTVTTSCSPCTDFPAAPVIDANTPANAASLFGSPTSGASSGGPCLLEPEVGALFPNNWTRPQFQIQAANNENVFEIRLHAATETNDLVVYTTSPTWTMPADMWSNLASHVQDAPITMTVRGVDSTSGQPSPALGTTGVFTIAPVPASGAMVYWATSAFDNSAMSTQLKGFHVGEETVVSALQTSQVAEKVRATWGSSLSTLTTQVQCIGCHTSTPDGNNVAFTAQWPWPNALASLAADGGSSGGEPDFLTDAALSNLSPNVNGAYATGDVQKYMLGIQTFSRSHYTTGDRIVVTTQGSSWYRQSPTDMGSATGVVAKLMWFDLEATSVEAGEGFGEVARTGDTNSAAAPNWSHDGQNIVYASTDTGAEDGRMGQGNSDLMVVPYNDKQGGAATKLMGASDPAYAEYYPAYSPDDALIAFNRVPSGMSMYIQPAAEVFVVPASGGQAVRLKANDPVACSGATSPGVQNTWPKWAPAAPAANGKTYYWLIFSSTRTTGGKAQLYVTALVQNGTTLETYPSIYLWNQEATLNNLIPAWDNFQIPPAHIAR